MWKELYFIMLFVSEYQEQLAEVFSRYKVVRAYLFGSAVRNDFNENSDVDFLIHFDKNLKDPLEKGKLWWDLHDELRDLLGREIDLVTENSLKNPYFIQELNKTKFLIYDSEHQEIFV
ncbi:MAG: nucleotidyltransferase domain-containing protein [Bergeyella sp.]